MVNERVECVLLLAEQELVQTQPTYRVVPIDATEGLLFNVVFEALTC